MARTPRSPNGSATFLLSFAIVLVGGAGGVALISIRLLPLGVAVYQYAVSGHAPGEFDREMLQSAFVRR